MIKDLQLSWTKNSDGENSIRQYLDFIVSGQPLREYLGSEEKSSVTPFGFFPNEEMQKKALKEYRLQQSTQLPGDRIELIICECCGDIGCGSITARIVDKGSKIIWTDFAFQRDPDEIGEEIQVEQIEFDRQMYFRALTTVH